jgi:hypothetical protein
MHLATDIKCMLHTMVHEPAGPSTYLHLMHPGTSCQFETVGLQPGSSGVQLTIPFMFRSSVA